MPNNVLNMPQKPLSALQATIKAIKALRGQPDGFVGTDQDGFATTTQLGSGTPAATNFLRGDGAWQPASGATVADGDYIDIVVTGGGATWTVDTAGGIEYVNSLAQLTAAVSALTTGGIIHIAPGTYTLTETLVLPYANLVLRGSGKGVTNIRYTADYDTDIISIQHGNITIDGMSIYHGTSTGNGQGGVGSGRGIVIEVPTSIASNVPGPILHDLEVLNTGEWCIYETGFYSPDDMSYGDGFASAGTFTNTAEHPFPIWGFVSSKATTYVINGGTTLGGRTVTSAALFANVRVGQYLTGTGIPHATRVTAKASNSSITISKKSTAATGTYALTFQHTTNCAITIQTEITDCTAGYSNSGGVLFLGSGGTTARINNLKTNNYSFGSFTRDEAAPTVACTRGAVHVYNHINGVFNNCIFQSPSAQSGGPPVTHADTDAVMLSIHQSNTIDFYSPYFEVLSTYCEGGTDWRGSGADAFGYRQNWFICGGGNNNILFESPLFLCNTKKKSAADLATYGDYVDGYPIRILRTLDDAGGFGFEMHGGRVNQWRLYYGSAPFPTAAAPFSSGDFFPCDENGNSTSDPWDRDDFLLDADADGTQKAPIVIQDLDIVNTTTGFRREPTSPTASTVWNHEVFRIGNNDRSRKFGFWQDAGGFGGTSTMDDARVRLAFSKAFRGGELFYSIGSGAADGAIQREGWWGISGRGSDVRQIPWIRLHTSAWPNVYAGDMWMKLATPVAGVYTAAAFRYYNGSTWQVLVGIAEATTATGDLIYYSAADVAARRAIGATGDLLTVVGGLPTWAAPEIADNLLRVKGSGDATKKLALEVDGITTATTRTLGVLNLSGTVPVVGDDPPAVAAGSLGKVDLTAKVADIGTTNLSSTPPAGLYLVEAYLLCTTADAAAGMLTVTIGWTDTVGATTSTPILAFPLTATNRTTGQQLVQVASGDITYAVAISGIYATAQYAVYVRVVALG